MVIIWASLMLMAPESGATVPPAAQADSKTAEAPDPGKKICKRQPVTGQLQGTKRICMTAEQWKRALEAGQRSRR